MSDVARRAGVHPATVSRALRDDPRITEEQCARVREAAARLGYRTNPLVAALMAARRAGRQPNYRATLAFITKYPPERAARFREDFGALLVGARRRAQAQGYTVEEFNLAHPDLSSRRASDILRHRAIRGLLVAPLHSSHEHLDLDWADFNTVAVGYSFSDVPVSRVVHNHFTAYGLAARHCREAGWQKLGLVLPRRVHEKVEKRWVAAHLLDQSERPAATRVPPLLLDEGLQASRQFSVWFHRHRPEVLLGPTATELLRLLDELRLGSPRDVSVVSLDRRPGDKGIAGIDQGYADTGGSAVDLLIGLNQRNEVGLPAKPVTAMTDGEWVEGASLGRA